MAAVTREQALAARAAGLTAGRTGRPSMPNPYAPADVPPWDSRRRTAAARAQLEAEQRPALILARVWRAAFTRGREEAGRYGPAAPTATA